MTSLSLLESRTVTSIQLQVYDSMIYREKINRIWKQNIPLVMISVWYLISVDMILPELPILIYTCLKQWVTITGMSDMKAG